MSRLRRVGFRLISLVVITAIFALVVAVLLRNRGADVGPTTGDSDTAGLDTAGLGIVDRVIDGDTIDVIFGDDPSERRIERVRMIGINTPEIAHEAWGTRPSNEADCLGPEAADFTRLLLPAGTSVRIERDIVARDDYGRILGYVYARKDTGDEIFVNFELVRQGFAKPLSIEPNTTYRTNFADAARDAEQADLGLWSVCN